LERDVLRNEIIFVEIWHPDYRRSDECEKKEMAKN